MSTRTVTREHWHDTLMAEQMREAWAEQARRNRPPVWAPQAGPQAQACESMADVIGYGGAAGGGKTDLLLGLAGTEHHRAVIFRRVFPLLEAMEARSREIFNPTNDPHIKDSYNEALHRWSLVDGATLRFTAMQYEKDKGNFQGRPYDFYGFDEVTEFTETQVRFVIGWNRTTRPNQRCRVVMTFNPPMDDSGSWVIGFFGPWLDDQHPNPAQDGEIRYFAMIKDKEVERENGEPFFIDGEADPIIPKSRTFFHAKLSDNPILEATGYGATIDAMPEPLRSALKGNFNAMRIPNPMQLIKPEWVRAANARWLAAQDKPHGAQSAVGGDISRGGADQTTIAKLYGDYFAPLLKYPGVSVPDGPTAAGLIIAAIEGQPAIAVDIIGYGASCYDFLVKSGHNVQGVNFGAGTDITDKSGILRMKNIRAGAYWLIREALDPENGSTLALPPDAELLADLCAPVWKLDVSGRVQIEDKDEIKARLGRSPDCGDAVVLTWYGAYNSGPLFWG